MLAPNGLFGTRSPLILLNWILIAVSCVSLIFCAKYYPQYHIHFHASGLFGATSIIAAFSLVSLLFAFARKSFGYIIGFYFYLMIAGYLWLNCFSEFAYDHQLAGLSAVVSMIAFLLPALFISSPTRRLYTLSSSALNRLLTLILLIGLATILIGASYNFKLVSIENIYHHRPALSFPVALNYTIGITSNALLPFAFACFVSRADFWRGGATLLLLLLLYPVTLSKLVLFTPSWLLTMWALQRYFGFKLAITLSLLVPTSIGLLLIILSQFGMLHHKLAASYFGLVNFRMVAFPSLALDYYNNFFSNNPVTYFCQIRMLKPFISCPYQDQLGDVIYNAFGIGGQFNASLFATEGIASVGTLLAPVTAFVAGLVIAIGNRFSSGLPPQFVLISGAIVAQALLNVPLSTVLLTHGAGLLFLLWYITPRDMAGNPKNGRASPESQTTVVPEAGR